MKTMKTLNIALLLLIAVPLAGYTQSYFQQEVNYTIEVSLDDQNHMLHGFEKIRYTNHAPEALNKLHFHLWPNAYKNNQTTLASEQFEQDGRHFLFDIESQQGYMDSLDFRVNDKQVKWQYHPDHIDICTIKLNQPLESGETIEITTPFRVKIPRGVTSRMGHIGQSYKITQWYPKPAVYDQRGWHPMPYRDMGEFYSEYGSFDVSITLPENYVVAASGELQTPSERKWLEDIALETKGKFSFNPDDMDFPVSAEKTKTIRFTLEHTHDFAWFADKRYHVMQDSVKLPQSGRTVTSRAYFTNDQAELWRSATQYINNALTDFSKWYGDYPWDNCSAILGAAGSRGNGMEYPTITAIGHTQQPRMLEQVIMHEVGHNWFYGMLGFNERRHPFLDEGLTTFSEIRYMNARYPGMKLYEVFGMSQGLAKLAGIDHMRYTHQHEMIYLLTARKNLDQSTNTASADFTRINYGAVPYSKMGLAVAHLKGYLGDETFNRTMRDFFEKWKFRHPWPEDLRASFKHHTEKKLDWFFGPLVNTSGKIDYAMKRLEGNRVLVSNRGDIAAPLVIGGITDGQTIFTRWYAGFDGSKWLELPEEEADLYRIDPNHNMLELYRHNNTIRARGLLPKVEPLNLHFLGLINNPRLTQVHFVPSLGWNYYDKTMVGLTLYDAIFPPDLLDYYLTPLYSTAKKKLSGQGEVAFNFYPNKTFRRIQLKFSGKQFAYQETHGHSFNRLRAEANFTLSKPEPRSRVRNKIRYAFTYATDIEELYLTPDDAGHNMYHKLSLIHDKSARSINPYLLRTDFEYGGSFLKASLEASYKLSYYRNEGLNIRLFGGTFLYKEEDVPWFYAYHLSGGNGFKDYTYDQTFLGRFEHPMDENANQFLAQQFYPDEGAFALYSPLGITRDWLASMNISSSLPLIQEIPIEAYAHFGAFGETQPLGLDISNNSWALETGVKFSFLQMLDIYFPIVASNNLEKASNWVNTRYGEKIRFHLKFNLLHPSRMLEGLDF
ncbi:MAG: M1 family metallopeptidase [Bacteroidales bacterium]|nr:M1 family metallopeptidase [Bacteroidales bacterium]